MRLRSILLLAGASLLWGSGWVLAPSLAEVASPFTANTLLFAVAALALSPALLLKSSEPRVVSRWTLLLALTLLAAPVALLTEAGRHGGSSLIPLGYAALPLAVMLFGEGWSSARAPASVVAIGATLVLLNGFVPISTSRLAWAVPVLVAVGLQAFALRYAAAHLASFSGAALLRSLAAQFGVAAAVSAALSLSFDPAPRLLPLAQWSAAPALALAALGALGTALPYALLLHLLARARLRPEQAAAAQWLQLLFAFAEGAVLTRARPPIQTLVAAGVLLFCFVAMMRAPDPAGDAPLSLR